jgi:hypothetical protein
MGGHNSRTCGEIAKACVCMRLSLPSVIVREGGRSSIPEKVVMESKSRGVLDTPPSRGMTTRASLGLANTAKQVQLWSEHPTEANTKETP